MLTFVFNALFGLLYLGPSVAFGAYVSSCTIFLNVSYVSPVVVLLIRGRGVLKEWQSENTFFALGKSGWIVNWVAAIFVVVTSVVGPPRLVSVLISTINSLLSFFYSFSPSPVHSRHRAII